jgi:hypothetical protein
MVAALGDRWQAGAVRQSFLVSILATLAATGSPAVPAVAAGPGGGPALAQTSVGTPDAPRIMVFSWTLYPGMWAEIDIRLAAGAEAVAEVTAGGGEVSWNLHSHPVEESPATFVILAQGAAARATVRCAPDAPGFYSYLFGNDRNPGTVRLHIELRLSGDARLVGVKP